LTKRSQSLDRAVDFLHDEDLAKIKACDIPIYRPYYDVPRPKSMPSIVNIIDSKERVYLKPEYEDLAFSSLKHARPISSSRGTPMMHNGELDLGLDPLQKIIYKMRRLQSEAQCTIFDKDAARAAGIMPYCSYLVGDKPKPKSQRRLSNKRVHTKHAFKTK
jgi:hypothetical protein